MKHLQEKLEAIFQDFHRHPEISSKEFRTTKKIKEYLTEWGVKLIALPLPVGALAQIGTGNGPVAALRCDLDALPVQEETGLPYASEVPGCMHACGHDFHMTSVLGAAMLLKERESQLKGTVRLIFQPAEEINEGAVPVLRTGLLGDVSEYYGIHTDPGIPAGTLGIREGAVMACPDHFQIRIHGHGGHGAQPHLSSNPIPCAASAALALQQAVPGKISPFSPCVLSVCRIQAGDAWNVIPGQALLEGTLRTMSDMDRATGISAIRQIAEYTAKTWGCTAETVFFPAPPPVVNNADLAVFAAETACSLGIRVIRQEPSMIGEDFAEYLRETPGCFIRVGTGIGPGLHHSKFKADPSVLSGIADYLAELVIRRLDKMCEIQNGKGS
ncbi:MAG: amidohydrolase [Lachnospiraceae bacterium]|nr:amidohydrolase [Lachnospiraceae bacterium]